MQGVEIQPAPVRFISQGASCAADLWLPQRPLPAPAVVLANGFSGTKDWIVPRFAARFAAAGLVALTFDYRHLGLSAGQPRQLVDLRRQRADLRAAFDLLRGRPEVDARRVALWGTSLGGSHVVEFAAGEPSVAAVVCTMPALDAVRGTDARAKIAASGMGRGAAAAAMLRLASAAVHDVVRGALGMQPRYLAVYGPPGQAFFTDPALAERFGTVARESPSWKNAVAARFLFRPPRYRSGTLERIRAPVFFSLATRDLDVSPAFIKQLVAGQPGRTVREYDAGHFDLYHPPLFDRVVGDQVAFLAEVLDVEQG